MTDELLFERIEHLETELEKAKRLQKKETFFGVCVIAIGVFAFCSLLFGLPAIYMVSEEGCRKGQVASALGFYSSKDTPKISPNRDDVDSGTTLSPGEWGLIAGGKVDAEWVWNGEAMCLWHNNTIVVCEDSE